MNKIEQDLYGLILSGGKSTRMGTDKGVLEYHGKPQREYLFELAEQFCDAAFYSIRQEQLKEFTNQPIVVDKNEYRGPFNGILSAHEAHPNRAWFVLACDLPFFDDKSVLQLLKERDLNKDATAFATHKNGLPEPLIAIWELSGLRRAKDYLKTVQNSCPRKFLLNSDINLVYPKTDKALYNANMPNEFEHAKSILKNEY